MNIQQHKEHMEFIENLKPGDRVAIHSVHQFGWTGSIEYYRYETISRITPKRTKVEFEGGYSLERHEINQIYPITADTDAVNDINDKRTELWRLISDLQETNPKKRRRLDCLNIPLDKMGRAIEILTEIREMLEIKEENQ